MKATTINGVIVLGVPKTLESPSIVNLRSASDIKLKSLGFYDVITPEINDNQALSDIYFDNNNKIYTYNVIDKDIDLGIEKIKKIAELKQNANYKFSETQWYYDRENRFIKNGLPIKQVPEEIIAIDAEIYLKVDLKEEEINGLTTYAEILAYDISL
jgi:hypothetical protein